MKRLVLLILLTFLQADLAWAGRAEGWAAYARGDYETALKELLPLAEQGTTNAHFALTPCFFLIRPPEGQIRTQRIVVCTCTQGQRTLNPLCRNNFHQELVAPAGDLVFSSDAVVRGVAFEEADGEAAKPRKIVGHVSLAGATLVLVERDIENPMQ